MIPGIMTRHGHHCAHPLHHHLQCKGTLRASVQFYNTHEETDRFASALTWVIKLARATAKV
jgi:cysteine desulfurase/selenocysteine lyase